MVSQGEGDLALFQALLMKGHRNVPSISIKLIDLFLYGVCMTRKRGEAETASLHLGGISLRLTIGLTLLLVVITDLLSAGTSKKGFG